MNFTDIATIRLESQHILQADFTSAATVVSWMGAMQAQDYAGALWAIGLRTPHLSLSDIEQAIMDREIVRTWPMRGTLHFVAAEDIRWMLTLLTPRILAATASRRRQLEIDDEVLNKSRRVIERALTDTLYLTRNDLCAVLEANNIATTGQRGIHILLHLSELGILCFGPHQGKQPTFALLERWLPSTKHLDREESLATFARRYFTSHGPASLKDFAGWGHLPMNDARLAINLAGDTITMTTIAGIDYWHSPTFTRAGHTSSAFLLPGFDEFMLGYKDRSPALVVEHAQKVVPGNNGVFLPTIVIDGQVVGIWKKTLRKSGVTITLLPFQPLSSDTLTKLERAAIRYGDFLGTPTSIAA